MRRTIGILSLVLTAAASAVAEDLPRFDVASVKPSPEVAPGQNININLGTARHGEVTLTNTNLSDCIRYAYGLVSDEQISGPDWMRSYKLRFDIDAKAPVDTPVSRLLQMLQQLLTERFRLAIHREPKPMAHLELSVAKGGPKLKVSKDDGAAGLVEYGPGRLFYNHVPLHTLAVLLSRQLKQPVLDVTGIEGNFDVKLEWRPDGPQPVSKGPDAAPAKEADDMAFRRDLFGAVQAQLGLKLEPKKTPMDVLVIDHAEQVPVGN